MGAFRAVFFNVFTHSRHRPNKHSDRFDLLSVRWNTVHSSRRSCIFDHLLAPLRSIAAWGGKKSLGIRESSSKFPDTIEFRRSSAPDNVFVCSGLGEDALLISS